MDRFFAISDIHGCLMPLYELVVKELDLKKKDRLIFLGDYIDRGDHSKEVIDFIIDLKDSGFNITTLTGNHEQMLLDSYDDETNQYLWFINDGMTTLESFGIDDIHELDKKYLDFFSGLEYYHKSGDHIFVHAGFNDNIADPFSDRHTMIWESSPGYTNPLLRDKIIVHGHRPKRLEFVQQKIDEKSSVIPIDTGCVYGLELGYGYLSALEIGSMNLLSVPNELTSGY